MDLTEHTKTYTLAIMLIILQRRNLFNKSVTFYRNGNIEKSTLFLGVLHNYGNGFSIIPTKKNGPP